MTLASPSPFQRKVAVAACFGTFLEWYDFLTFAALATYFSELFFPGGNPVAALLASLATFGVGMLVRPLGAALFGSLGDRHGRRPAFIATIVLMGGATFAVGLLPTYASAGMLAPAALVALRLVQGLAVGGEIGGAAVYLTEHAPTGRRGTFTSVLQLMGPLGMLASTLQIVALQYLLSDADFRAWGWRVPFLLSAVLLLVSLKSRIAMHESPVFEQLRAANGISRAPLRECLGERRTLGRMALLFFCVSSGGSLLFFSSQVYTGVFLKNVVGLGNVEAGALGMLATLTLFPLTLLAGWLSDRAGRRPVLLAGLLLGALAILPVFHGLLHYGNPALERFQREVPVVLYGASCEHGPFDSSAHNDCERNQAWLARHGVAYVRVAAEKVAVHVGNAVVAGFQPDVLARTLAAAGWPRAPAGGDRAALVLWLMLLTVALALVTGPQTAYLAELFPARTRYSAVALPHNLSAGWIGGLSPFVVTWWNAQAGNALAGLWYLVGWLGLAFVVGAMFLPETRDTPLEP